MHSALKTQVDSQLIAIIQRGDSIETLRGLYVANGAMSERFGTMYYHACVNVQMGEFGVPVFSDAIQAVWRGGVCVWRRGESLRQLSLFSPKE